MIQISTRDAARDIHKEFSHLTRYELQTATVRALNRTAYAARTRLNKSIRAQYNFPSSHVLKTSLIIPATANTMTATIIVKAYPTPIGVFKPKQVGDDVTVTIKKGKTEKIKNTVIMPGQPVKAADGKSVPAVKSRGRYVSKFKPDKTDRLSRLSSLSTAAASNRDSIKQAVADRIAEYFPDRLRHELSNISRKLGH